MDDLANKLRDYLNTEKGRNSSKEYFGKIILKKKILNIRIDKFESKYNTKEKFVSFVEKVIEKYNSEKYKKRWYGHGDPPYTLYWFLCSVAERHGRDCIEEEWKVYGNSFTGNLYYLSGYYFGIMYGQGCAINVTRELNLDDEISFD